MINIHVSAKSVNGFAKQVQSCIGGEFEDNWGERILKLDNDIAKGYIKVFDFDWGVSLLEFNITFFEDVLIIADTTNYNPIHFIFNLKGNYAQGFEFLDNIQSIEQFQSVIMVNKSGGENLMFFPKDTLHEVNTIQILRRKFLKKKLNNISMLNKELYEVFVDKDHLNRYAYFGTLNLIMSDHVKSLKNIKSKGLTRILQLEAKIYIILSLHIQQHNLAQRKVSSIAPINNTELSKIREIAAQIIDNPSHNYTLADLSYQTGLSQAKLQEGFKFLFHRTVTEFIRHTRLKAAREFFNTTDMNISEVVYAIGFTSRSYFSKIFKAKYNVSPTEYRKHARQQFVA